MKTTNTFRLKLIDLLTGLKIYDALRLFKKEQYLSKKELDEIRKQRLDRLFAIAIKSTVYYTGFNSFDELPVLTKKIINNNPTDFLSNIYDGKLFKKSTSGSTGTPFFYNSSANAQSHLWAGLLHSWESSAYRFGDKVAIISGSALVKTSSRHSIFYQLMNMDVYPVGTLTDKIAAAYIEKIRQKKTRLIYGYAMAINIIADYMIQNNIAQIKGLLGIVSTAEMLTDKTRANIEKAFGCKVFNQYGCNEAGIASFECEQHQLHLISSRCMYEIDNEGNLIGTDLANEACILMKFKTGDLVEFSEEACSCGRNYPVIKNIIGRSDDIITDRNNKKIHSSYFNFMFKKDKSIKQYQVLFDEKSLCLNLLVDDDFSDKNYHHLMSSVKDDLDFEEYEIKTVEQFYTNKNLKHTYIIDKRKHKQPTLTV